MIKAVIFDMDGTLVTTKSEYRYGIVGKALAELGAFASYADMDRFWFEGNRDETIKRYFHVSPADFWEMFRKHEFVDERRMFTYAYNDLGAIDNLRAKGCKTGILTSAPEHIARMNFELVGNRFDAFSFDATKPSPDGLLNMLGEFKVSATRALYVGNAEEDIQTGRNSGVLPVLIIREKYQEKTKADIRVSSLYELSGLL